MKKMYESPVAEKIEFRYADQVVASGHTMGDIFTCPGAMQKPEEEDSGVPSAPPTYAAECY